MMIGLKINPWLNAFAGVILFSILFLPDLYLSKSLPAFRLLDFLLPVLLIIIVLKRKEIVWRPFYIFIGIVVLYIFLTMIINGRLAMTRDYFEFYKIYKFFLIVVFFSIIDGLTFLKTFIKPFFLLLVLLNLIHFYNLFNFNFIIEHYYHGGLNIKYFGTNTLYQPTAKRMVGLMGNPNNNAILFTFFSIYFIPFKFEKSKIAWFSIALTMVFLCQSRTSILAIIALIVVLLILKYTNWNFKQWVLFIGTCLVCYLLAWTLSSDFFKYDIYGNSMFNGVALESNSAMGRIESWKFLGKMIAEKPVFGHGPNKDFFYNNNIYSENEYVLYAWRYGIIGLVMYLLFYLIPVKAIAMDSKTKYSKYIILIAIMMLTTALTNNPLTERTIFILFAMSIGVLFKLTDGMKNKKLNRENGHK